MTKLVSLTGKIRPPSPVDVKPFALKAEPNQLKIHVFRTGENESRQVKQNCFCAISNNKYERFSWIFRKKTQGASGKAQAFVPRTVGKVVTKLQNLPTENQVFFLKFSPLL